MIWGGLRGALALALALGISDAVPGASDIDGVMLGVVVISVVIQGLTLQPLIRRVAVV
jgi:CPA1 family monovalent cation:H+ antiporter